MRRLDRQSVMAQFCRDELRPVCTALVAGSSKPLECMISRAVERSTAAAARRHLNGPTRKSLLRNSISIAANATIMPQSRSDGIYIAQHVSAGEARWDNSSPLQRTAPAFIAGPELGVNRCAVDASHYPRQCFVSPASSFPIVFTSQSRSAGSTLSRSCSRLAIVSPFSFRGM